MEEKMTRTEIQLNFPFWGHLYNNPQIRVEQFNKERYTLVICSPVIDLVIRKASTIHPNMSGWLIDWRIKTRSLEEKGAEKKELPFSREDIEVLFGLNTPKANVNSDIKTAVLKFLELPE